MIFNIYRANIIKKSCPLRQLSFKYTNYYYFLAAIAFFSFLIFRSYMTGVLMKIEE